MNTANTAAASSAKRPWTGGEKFLLGTILALVVLVAAGALWWSHVNAMPSVTVPTPAMPSPNAYDDFQAAGNAVVDGDKIGYAIESPSAAHTNKGLDRAYTPAEQAALVQENAGALRLLRQGFAHPYQNPPVRSFSTLLPYYAKFRGMARLLHLEGEVAEARGDWAGSVGSQLDAVELGAQVPRGGPLIGMLVGIACQAIGRRPLWADVDHLSAAQAAAAARRMERLSARQVPYADSLQEEKWTVQAGLMEVFRRPNWAAEFASSPDRFGESSQGTAPNAARLFWVSLTNPKRVVMDHYTGYMDRNIADAGQPYAAGRPAPAIPDDPVSAAACPDLAIAKLKYADNETQNALLTTTLALRAYRLGHGAYPATLSALVPGYLARVPDDPFAPSGPPRYRRQGTAYLLYSVGPDGKDDGGRAIFDAAKPAPAPGVFSDQRRFVQADSRGDIVAGVNLF